MKKTKIKGQALVETAFVVPLLTFLLVGIGYFGRKIEQKGETAFRNLGNRDPKNNSATSQRSLDVL